MISRKCTVGNRTPIERKLYRRAKAEESYWFYVLYGKPHGKLLTLIGLRIADQQILHLINYAYDAERDAIAAARGLEVSIPGVGAEVGFCRLLDLDGEHSLRFSYRAERLIVEIPHLDVYGLLVIE